MALKLKVPWRTEPLPVSARGTRAYLKVIDKIKQSGSPYVRTVGNDVFVMNFFKDNNKVPDVIRYRIGAGCVPHDDRCRICNGRYLIRHCDIPESRLQIQQQTGSIVLLLESPHECEYEYIDKWIVCFSRPFTRPKAPASGRTGENIDRCLGTVLERIREKHISAARLNAVDAVELAAPERHIIISNPIQLQTSLHAIHGEPIKGSGKTLRNNVWKTLWDEEHIKECFLARLTAYSPCLIINACTGKLTPRGCLNRTNELTIKHGLKCLVTKYVRAELPNVPLYETDHPAVKWNRRDRRGCRTICIQRIPPQPEPIG